MTNSILTSTKKALGIEDDDTSFDPDVVMYINAALSELHDLGIGPELGFTITDKTATWDDLLGDTKLFEDVKTYVYLFVRLIFDPPSTSFGISAMEKQIEKRAWLINARREGALHPMTDESVNPDE